MRLVLAALVWLVCLYAFVTSSTFPSLAGYFPRFASAFGLALATVEIGSLLRVWLQNKKVEMASGSRVTSSFGRLTPGTTRFIGWAVGLPVLIYGIGSPIAIVLWLLAYLRLGAGMSWPKASAGVLSMLLLLTGFQYVGLLTLPDAVWM